MKSTLALALAIIGMLAVAPAAFAQTSMASPSSMMSPAPMTSMKPKTMMSPKPMSSASPKSMMSPMPKST